MLRASSTGRALRTPSCLALAALVASLTAAGCHSHAPTAERVEPRRLSAQELSYTGPGVEYLLPIHVVELSSHGQPLVRPEMMDRSLRDANYVFRPAGVQFHFARVDRIVAPELAKARSHTDPATPMTPTLLNDLRQIFPSLPPSYRPTGAGVMTRFFWIQMAALDFADDNEILLVIPEGAQAGYGFLPWQGRHMLIGPSAFSSFEWNLGHELGHYLGLPHIFPGIYSDSDFYSTTSGKVFMRDPSTGRLAKRADLWELVYANQGGGLQFFGSRDEASHVPDTSLLAKDGSNGNCTITAGTCDTVCTAVSGLRFSTTSAPASPGVGLPYMSPTGTLNLGYNVMGYASSPGCNQGLATSQIEQVHKALRFDISHDEHPGRTGRRPRLGQRPGLAVSSLPAGPTPLAALTDRAHRTSLDDRSPSARRSSLASSSARHPATCSLPGRASASLAASASAPGVCAEASGLAGPAMVKVPAADGSSYCVDATEVTQGQYDVFRRASERPGVPGTEHPACVGRNDSYEPPVGTPESSCAVDSAPFSPAQTPDAPVSCVDWCDAYAYCAWAGKRLCGAVGGGSADDSAAATNQWTNACTAAGTSAPLASLRDLAGGRAEWQDACEGDGPDDLCAVRGAASAGGTDACTQSYLTHRSAALGRDPGVGFRCCLDP